jgi:EpsI family protein
VLLAAAAFLRTRTQAEQLPPREQLASFPMRVGDWTGREVGVSEAVRDFLGDGDFMDRVYLRRPEEPYVDLYIAYFPTQRTGNTIHSPQNCLPGAGWTPVERGRVVLKGPMGETVRANRYIIAKGLDRRLVLYWYQSHGRAVASEYWAKFYLVADSVRMNRSDGALVRVVTSFTDNNDLPTAESRAREFATQILPILDQFIPR